MVTASVCHAFPKPVYSYFKYSNPDNIIDEISIEDVVYMEVIEAINKVKSMYGYSRAGIFLNSIHNNEVENCHRPQYCEIPRHF